MLIFIEKPRKEDTPPNQSFVELGIGQYLLVTHELDSAVNFFPCRFVLFDSNFQVVLYREFLLPSLLQRTLISWLKTRNVAH